MNFTSLVERLRSGWGAVVAASVWSVIDALVHVIADEVEPARIAGNVAAIGALVVSAFATRVWGGPKLAAIACGIAAGVVVGINLAWVAARSEIPPIAAVFVAVALVLLVWAAWRFLGEAAAASVDRHDDDVVQAGAAPAKRSKVWVGITGLVLAVSAFVALLGGFISSAIRQLHDDKLVEADYWDDELVILSAGMGFDNIIGTPGDDFDATVEAMGSWYADPDCVDPDGPISTNVDAGGVSFVIRGSVEFDDGLPIVFSWPVLTSTVHPDDFLFTLNDGSQVMPNAVTMTPNWENNERNTIVAFGDFGNRGRMDEPDALFPVRLDIVDDDTPLTFVGPSGTQSAVGLSWETDRSAYDTGPSLVGAKLNRIGDEPEGEGGVGLLESSFLPNDEFALYGGGDFKVRILTTGGFSPDGLTGITPDQFEDFFRLHATGPNGDPVLMTETGVDYELDGGSLRIVGMSDLGKPAGDDVHYDDCYAEDSDNYIDMILVGDEAAARGLTHLEIPAGEDGYLPLYNPGGPGPEPFPDVRYIAPGPPDLEPIIDALDDPMRVSFGD